MRTRLLQILLFIIASGCFSGSLLAQYFSTGQNPASVKWKQINTARFQIIFPEGFESTANYVANTLEYASLLSTKTMKANPKKVPVVIHNFTSTSNGMVVWAPRRMELYTIPPQNTYAQEWFQQLAIHEYRHVVQISKLNQGITKVLEAIFGEHLTGSAVGLFVPLWFLEGDAVATETALSNAGRGRQPSFAMPLRAQILDKGIYHFDKAIFKSYKEFVPDHYVLGYHLVAEARKHFGADIWNHAIDKVARKPFIITPLSRGIRDISGFKTAGLYNAMMDSLQKQWQKQYHAENHTQLSDIVPATKLIYTNYNKPHPTSRGTIVAEKKALDEIARFVEIDEKGNEKIVFTPGYYYPGTLSYANGVIAWGERKFDPRWHHRTYAVVRMYNLSTGMIKTLTGNNRYFAPVLAPDGALLAAVEVTEDQQYSLVILSTATGNVLQRITTPENYFFTWPDWSDDGKKVATIIVGDQGKAIAVADPSTGALDIVSDFTFTDISKPAMHERQIAFVGAWSGIDNLYLLDIPTRSISRVTSVEYGVTDPTFDENGESLLFANYTADGYDLARISLDQIKLTPLDDVEDHSHRLYQKLAEQEGNILEPEQIPRVQIDIKKYSKLKNAFNFHSWAPLALDVQNMDANPGVSFFSQNLLSSAFTTLGYAYDLNEQTGKTYITYSYAGWYPVIDITADYGKRKSYTVDEEDNRIDFSWMETNFKAGIHLPLNFTSGMYSWSLRPAVEFNYTQLDLEEDAGVVFRRNNYKTINYRLNTSNYMKMSAHDIYPRWGQLFGLTLRTAPFEGDELGSMFAGEGRLYFPGLLKHNSFNVYAGFQKRINNNLYYGNIVRFPRGYSGQYADQLTSWSLNYGFPIGYPDLNLSPIIYVKRIRANTFYDNATGLRNGAKNHYESAGMEIFTDNHLFQILVPITLGYRFIFIPATKAIHSEFLFSINFDAL
jgi:hypothetical protein